MTVDISSLPAPEVIESLVFETIVAEIKADFVSRYPDAAETIDLESEPVVKLIETMAYRDIIHRSRYNDEAKALLLAYSTGANLDHIGITYYQEPRLVVTPEDTSTTPTTPAVMEKDSDYRQRLAMKPESYSVAGPRDAYAWHAKSADGQIKDVSVDSPEGGTTRVHVLSRTGNGVPDAALLAKVSAALNAETIRPLSEQVIVVPAALSEYSIEIDLIIFTGPAGEVVTQAAQSSLESFTEDHHRLNSDIIHSAIDAAAHVSGVKKATIISPATDIICDAGHAPYCTGITINVIGVE